jgi:hypothetical protein
MATNGLTDGWNMAAATLAMVRNLGGTKVMLCLGGSGEAAAAVGFGLSAPSMEAVELSPVLLRTKNDGLREIVVDAQTLEAAVGSSGEGLHELLRTTRVNLGDTKARIGRVSSDQLGGAAYLYRLSLED